MLFDKIGKMRNRVYMSLQLKIGDELLNWKISHDRFQGNCYIGTYIHNNGLFIMIVAANNIPCNIKKQFYFPELIIAKKYVLSS